MRGCSCKQDRYTVVVVIIKPIKYYIAQLNWTIIGRLRILKDLLWSSIKNSECFTFTGYRAIRKREAFREQYVKYVDLFYL